VKRALEENIEICVEYFKKMNAIDMMIEIELGITGGEEDGVDNSVMLTMLYFIHNLLKFVML
jgi:fructose/tagatose bisphosphate aldolase